MELGDLNQKAVSSSNRECGRELGRWESQWLTVWPVGELLKCCHFVTRSGHFELTASKRKLRDSHCELILF